MSRSAVGIIDAYFVGLFLLLRRRKYSSVTHMFKSVQQLFVLAQLIICVAHLKLQRQKRRLSRLRNCAALDARRSSTTHKGSACKSKRRAGTNKRKMTSV